MPSTENSEQLTLNHITQQTLLLNDHFGIVPTHGDTVTLHLQCFLWNSLRGYVYEIVNTHKETVLHTIGEDDVDANCWGDGGRWK